MTAEKHGRAFVPPSDPAPNPLDVGAKDPLREIYDGRWRQLPLIQKIGVTIVSGFWLVLIAVMVWGDGGQYLSRLAPFVLVASVFGVFILLFRRRGQ
jgi:hypothetical protein